MAGDVARSASGPRADGRHHRQRAVRAALPQRYWQHHGQQRQPVLPGLHQRDVHGPRSRYDLGAVPVGADRRVPRVAAGRRSPIERSACKPAVLIDDIYLGVAAIPEPSTYALMLAGLAGVGLLARRRRAGLIRVLHCPGALRCPFFVDSPMLRHHLVTNPALAQRAKGQDSRLSEPPPPRAHSAPMRACPSVGRLDAPLPDPRRASAVPSPKRRRSRGRLEHGAARGIPARLLRPAARPRLHAVPHAHEQLRLRARQLCPRRDRRRRGTAHGFNIDRDRQALLPFIQAAQQRGGPAAASCWPRPGARRPG